LEPNITKGISWKKAEKKHLLRRKKASSTQKKSIVYAEKKHDLRRKNYAETSKNIIDAVPGTRTRKYKT
jgi:hypothetical protein